MSSNRRKENEIYNYIKKILSFEKCSIKCTSNRSISIALAYPDVYQNGIASLAIATLYRKINFRNDSYAARVYLPEDKIAEKLNLANIPYFTWENGRPLKEYDIIMFSISFEELYPHVLKILDLAHIPIFSNERKSVFPLIITGGPVPTYNPEPIADFMDAIVIGDCEECIHDIINCFKKVRSKEKNEILNALAKIEGIYVPRFYEVSYGDKGDVKGFLLLSSNARQRIKRRFFSNLSDNPSRSVFITSEIIYGEPTFSLEFARGCIYACNFCQYSYTQKKCRCLSVERAIDIILKEGINDSHVIKIFYEGTPHLIELFKALDELIDRYKIKLRVGAFHTLSLSEEIIKIVSKGGQKIITLAPEAGNDFLRRIVGKSNVTTDKILSIVRKSYKNGIPNLGLYLMIGLPGEKMEDIKDLGAFILQVRREMDRCNTRGILEIHINPCFPKPFTPFQWASMEKLEVSMRKLKLLEEILSNEYDIYIDFVSKTIGGAGYITPKEIKRANIVIKTVIGTKMQFSQPILSLGDRRVGKVLLESYQKGNTLEAWKFAMKSNNLDPHIYFREKEVDEILPWFFIDAGVDLLFLKKKWNNIKSLIKTRL